MRDEIYRVMVADGGWGVFTRDGRRVSELLRAQSDGVVHAKELASRDGSAQIVVYDEHGKIVSDFHHQRAERPSLSHDDTTATSAASTVAHRHR
jgi:hypothetical protein